MLIKVLLMLGQNFIKMRCQENIYQHTSECRAGRKASWCYWRQSAKNSCSSPPAWQPSPWNSADGNKTHREAWLPLHNITSFFLIRKASSNLTFCLKQSELNFNEQSQAESRPNQKGLNVRRTWVKAGTFSATVSSFSKQRHCTRKHWGAFMSPEKNT